MDRLDQKLIEELQKDGRASHIRLASKLGVSEGTVRKRLAKLLAKNIIRVAAIPNLSALGYNLTSIIGIQVRMTDLRMVADALARKANVCRLAFVAGRYDLIAVVASQSHKALSDFIEKEVSTIPGVTRTETFVNLDVIKGEWAGIDTTQLVSCLDSSSLREGEKGE